MPIEHKNIADPDIHEPKGVATATSDQVYVANGAGGGVWTDRGTVQMGWYDYDDTTTSGSPIALTVANTDYVLTNDAAGTTTRNDYGLTGVTDVWDETTNRFDFSSLDIGDTVDIRIDIVFNSSASNDTIEVDLVLAEGTASEFSIPIVLEQTYKVSGAHRIARVISFYVGSTDVRDNPAKIVARSDTTGDTVEVNGWFVRVWANV